MWQLKRTTHNVMTINKLTYWLANPKRIDNQRAIQTKIVGSESGIQLCGVVLNCKLYFFWRTFENKFRRKDYE